MMAAASSKDGPFRDEKVSDTTSRGLETQEIYHLHTFVFGLQKLKAADDSEERYIRLLQLERDKRKVSKETLQSLRVCLATKPDT